MFGLLLGNQTPKFYHKPSNRAITNPIAMDRKMAGTVSLERNAHVPCHYTQKPGPSSQTGVEVVCNAFTTKVQNWTFFMSELIHCPSTFMSVSPRPIFCAVRGGPCRTPAQPPAATSAALPYLRKTAKIRRSSGTRPSRIFAKPQPSLRPLPYLRKTAKIRRSSGTRPSRIFAKPQPSLRPRQARPSRIFAKPQRFAGFREGRACRGRERGVGG